MMFIKWIKDLYKFVKIKKFSFITCYLIMIIVSTALGKTYISKYSLDGAKLCALDMLCDMYKNLGMLGNTSYMVIIFIFSLLVLTLLEYENKKLCIIKRKSRKELIRRKFFYVAVMSFVLIFTLIFLGYIISGILSGCFNNMWTSTDGIIYKLVNNIYNWNDISQNFSSFKVLISIFISGFLGLTAIGMFICILNMYIKNAYSIAIVVLQMYISVLFENCSIVFKQMHIYLPNLIFPISIIKNQIYLLAVILLLYKLGIYLIEKKDFLDKN